VRDLEATAVLYRGWAQLEAADRRPCTSCLAGAVAQAVDVLELLQQVPEGKRQPNLLLGRSGSTTLRYERARLRAAVPSPHRARGNEQHRHRVQRELQRLDQDRAHYGFKKVQVLGAAP